MPHLVPGKCRCLNALRYRFHTTDFTCLFRFLDYFFRKILGRFLVCFVYGLISFIAFCACTIVLPFEALYKPTWLIVVLYVFAGYLAANVLFHYFKASNTPPGSPPKVLQQPLCRYCHYYKPFGTHHCGICNQCVLKMDHHCVWINQCVGAQNHRHFLQFLALLVLSSASYVLVGFNTFYFNYWNPYTNNEYCNRAELSELPWFDYFCDEYPSRFVQSAVFFTSFLCLIIFFVVGGLFYWNIVLISTRMTYIELLQQHIGFHGLLRVLFCPLSNENFVENWRRFLGLKRGSGRTFLRHILLPSAHVAFVYEEDFVPLSDVRVDNNTHSHRHHPYSAPTDYGGGNNSQYYAGGGGGALYSGAYDGGMAAHSALSSTVTTTTTASIV